MMKLMKRASAALFAFALTGSVLATDYYVDADNGNDGNDGKTPQTARQTLEKAMELADVGDTVHAAEGTYSSGTMSYEGVSLPSRVVVYRGRRLVATGAREKTIIRGQGPNGPDAVRCVLLEGKSGDVAGGIIRGFTITGGATLTEGGNNELMGGGVTGLTEWAPGSNGLVVDCDIRGNEGQGGAPNVRNAVLLRCHVAGSWTDLPHSVAIDSVIDAAHPFGTFITLYNCTYTGTYGLGGWSNNTTIKNCLFTNPGYEMGSGAAYESCYFCSAKPATMPANTTCDENCRFGLTACDLAMLEAGGIVPTENSVLFEKGNAATYASATSSWLPAWKAELTGKDYGGNDRLRDGKIDIGANQCVPAPYMGDYYVDAVNGNDANDGRTAATARKTLEKAMELAVAGRTVYAAEGTYDSGSMAYEGKCPSRVVVRRGVRLVATGRQAQTVIRGQGPVGASAIRCVLLEGKSGDVAGGIIRGFTITGGYTEAGGYGGGVSGVSEWTKNGNGLAVDCHIYGNGAARGPNVYTTTLLRCRVGNCDGGDYDLFMGVVAIDSLYEGTQPLYQYMTLVNCTHTGANTMHGAYDGQNTAKDCVFTNPDFKFGSHFAYQNCLFAAARPSDTTVTFDSSCRFGVGVGELGIRAIPGKVLVSPMSVVLEKGLVSDHDAATASWSAEWKAELNGLDLNGNPRLTDRTISLGCCEEALPRGIYADAVKGDDANDGLSAATPKKTLAAAMEISEPYDIVYAAEGTYDDGSMDYDGCSIGNRVVVRRGRQLVATGDRAKTIIRGGGTPGVDPVRCVILENGADGLEAGIVEGFTITGGQTNLSGDNELDVRGGGVIGKGTWTHAHGCAVNCDIYGNNAYTAPNVYCANLIRCRIVGSYSDLSYSFALGSVVEMNQAPGTYCHLYSCTYTGSKALSDSNSSTKIQNCLFTNPSYVATGRGVEYKNCYFRVAKPDASGANSSFDGACRFGLSDADVALDADFRLAPGSAATDKGDAALYRNVHPELARYKDWDYAGGRRVYNGRIDVGAGECDMRGEYARVMSRSKAKVTFADSSVVKDGTALTFVDGSVVESTWTVASAADLDFSTSIDGTGTLTVTLNGVEVPAGASGYRLTLPAGESRLVFSYSGDGTARASDFHCGGFAIMIR